MQTQNNVQLLGYYGGDTEHACSAWTSTSRELTDEKRSRIGAMLRTLAQDGHHTPFEKSMLHFLVDAETASHIHLIKHRIAVSINGESARYHELKGDKYHLPRESTKNVQTDSLTVRRGMISSCSYNTIRRLANNA